MQDKNILIHALAVLGVLAAGYVLLNVAVAIYILVNVWH